MGSGPQAAKIDFSGLDPASPAGSKGWAEVRAQVVEALVTYGWFEAVYDKVSPELKESDLFGSAMKEVFGLPLDAKLRNISDKPFHGYLGQIPYLSYESLAVAQPHEPHAVKDFADLLWPQGSPANFCETVSSFSKLLAELDQMVHRMVLESFGAEKHYEPHMKTNKLVLRLSEYPAQQGDGEKKIGLVPHRDKNTLAIICQNQVDGLEMETKDGQWVLALPSSTSFIVIAGDTLRAWTNGRIYAPLHSINVGGNVTRHSTILFSMPEDDLVVEPMPELVDENHPSLFKPYTYGDYVRFCMSEEGIKAKNQLDAYCGVAGES